MKLKETIHNILIKIIQELRKLEEKFYNDEDIINDIYEDLLPKDNIGEEYFKEINFALKDKKVKNIAISGSYGAGKSSVIKTYQNKNKQYKYLNISLANFDDKKVESNQIEKDILKQMFYRVKHSKIPFSRYKRIKNLNTKEVLKIITPYIVLIITGNIIFNSNKTMSILNKFKLYTDFKKFTKFNIYRILIELTFIVFLICAIIKLVKILKGKLKINKINLIKDVEISSKDNDSESVFNKEIDEILYFFEVNKYDVVVFEDIDRFDNLDIFVKLRELNDLINNSEQVNRRVIFMYAIKDDIFKDGRDRTKFFDFIIPIIPVTNSSNSADIISRKLKKINLVGDKSNQVSQQLINDITLYVDDMRLLINVCNELIIYKENLNKVNLNLDLDNLFSMIVYKNLYPGDFALLQFNDGMVSEIFNNKEYLNSITDNLDKDIEGINEKLDLIEKEHLQNINELKTVYLEYLNIDQNKEITINSNLSVDYNNFKSKLFEIDLNSKVQYYKASYGHITLSMKDISTNNDKRESYYDRLERIQLKNKDENEKLKKKLEQLKNDKKKIKALEVKDLIDKYGMENIITNDETRKEKLIVYLIRNGYIDEMYHYYITYFHEGSLSNEDMKFVTSVKNHEPLEYNYLIVNTEKIMEKLHISDFEREEVLNVFLVEDLINNIPKYKIYYETILDQLANINKKNIEFINEFLQVTENAEYFIKTLCNKCVNLWYFIETRSNYPEDKKIEYLLYILNYAELTDIGLLNKENLLANYISNKEDFIEIARDYISDKEKLKNIMQILNVKFIKLDTYHLTTMEAIKDESLYYTSGIRYKRSDSLYNIELTDFIYENNLYEINFQMIEEIIKLYSENTTMEDLKKCNYTTIKKSSCNKLIAYIEENVDTYVSKVLLTIDDNTKEYEEHIINLLNNEKISLENKKKVISKQDTRIYDITKIDENLLSTIVKEEKFIIDWFNIVYLVNLNEEIKDLAIDLINKERIYDELSNKFTDKDEIDKNDIEKFCNYTMSNISTDSFKTLLPNIKLLCDTYINEQYLKSLVAESLNDYDKEKIHILIDNDLIDLNSSNFNILKNNFSDEHLYLIEQNLIDYLEDYTKYVFELDHGKSLINKIPNEEFMKKIEEHCKSYEKDSALNLLNKVFSNIRVETEKKVVLLNYFIDKLSNDELNSYIEKLDGKYKYIVNIGGAPILENNKENIELVENLKGKIISSYSIEGNKIKVNRKRNSN